MYVHSRFRVFRLGACSYGHRLYQGQLMLRVRMLHTQVLHTCQVYEVFGKGPVSLPK